MKNIVKYSLAGAAIVAVGLFSCQKDFNIAPQLEMEPYTMASLDENGGTWKPLHLTAGADVTVPAPAAANSAEYQTELAATKSARAAATASQLEKVEYWGANPVARWAQIASDLMAKYNLPPAPNADGSYTFPNADSTKNNPAFYPAFPFANPPYAARGYAYWGVAQFDALIAAWHWKKEYNRPALHKTDASIQPVLPATDLPSYPSEDAVIAAVSRTILLAMFPGEKDYINGLAEEHKNSRLWAGMNVASDLAWGDTLGRKVAQKILSERASKDGMGKAAAVGPASNKSFYWDSLATAAQTNFGHHWSSLETPVRPPMLPFFARVKMWHVPGGVASVRPGPPPAIGSDEFNRNADELKNYMDDVTAESRRIANFWSDGVGTYTPPGHWAITAARLVYKYKYNPLRSARVFAYLGTTLMDAGISCWDTKFYYHYPRPAEAIPGFKTLIGVPNFPAYTSGHSTFSGAAAEVLAYIFPAEAAYLQAQAKEASESRIISGIHYRFDCEVGLTSGKNIGGMAVETAKADKAD